MDFSGSVWSESDSSSSSVVLASFLPFVESLMALRARVAILWNLDVAAPPVSIIEVVDNLLDVLLDVLLMILDLNMILEVVCN